jgi:general secretion pathway protein K
MRSRRRQRGVAFLTAIVLVALATVVAATIAFDNAMTARRATAAFTIDQGLQFAGAAEALAAYALREDLKERRDRDDRTETWAQPYGPIEIVAGAWLEARLDDAQGRFNVNNLVTSEGEIDELAVAQFERLLGSLELEARWASLLADWIDRDVQPRFPDGGEDTLYSAQDPPYRAPNAPITSVSELLALPGFGAERYNRLVPYVTALPPGTPLNVCTAPGEVIDAVLGEDREFGIDPEALARTREDGCHPTLQELQGRSEGEDFAAVRARLAESSSWFGLRTVVSIGTTELALYSLLQRDTSGQVRPILRSIGVE